MCASNIKLYFVRADVIAFLLFLFRMTKWWLYSEIYYTLYIAKRTRHWMTKRYMKTHWNGVAFAYWDLLHYYKRAQVQDEYAHIVIKTHVYINTYQVPTKVVQNAKVLKFLSFRPEFENWLGKTILSHFPTKKSTGIKWRNITESFLGAKNPKSWK